MKWPWTFRLQWSVQERDDSVRMYNNIELLKLGSERSSVTQIWHSGSDSIPCPVGIYIRPSYRLLTLGFGVGQTLRCFKLWTIFLSILYRYCKKRNPWDYLTTWAILITYNPSEALRTIVFLDSKKEILIWYMSCVIGWCLIWGYALFPSRASVIHI